MPSTVKGVIARAKGAPVEVVDVVVPDPGPGEAVVQIQACGVCHTDLHYREGGINDEFPFLLGHEAAGVVESVGEGVTDVAPGDFVILNWRAVCGQCRACAKGKPQYCFNTAQRHAEDDADRRHRALAGARHRRVHREDAGGQRPVHQGRPRGRPGRGRPARLRRHGRLRRRRQHRRRRPRRLRGRDRVRRRRQRGHRRCRRGRRDDGHRRRRGRPQARVGHAASAPRTPSTARSRTRSRRSAPSPAASAPTSSSRRSGGRRPTSRRSTPATWPAPWSSSACRPPT